MIGIAIVSARAAGLQWRRSSSRSTNMPSEKRVRISASSTRWTTPESPAFTVTTSVAPSISPRATDSTDAERTVPFITPESAAVTARRAPNRSSASPKPMSIGAG